MTIERVELLASKDSFIGNDLNDIKNTYNRYINTTQRERWCMSCPGSIKQLINKFKINKNKIVDMMLAEQELKNNEDNEQE